MKTLSRFFSTLFFAFFLIALAGCPFGINAGTEEEGDAASETMSFKVPATSGKKVYAVLFNPTKSPIQSIRHITDAQGLNGFNAAPDHSTLRSAAPVSAELPLIQSVNFHPNDGIKEFFEKQQRRARFSNPVNTAPNFTVTPLTLEKDVTEKDLYVDTAINITTGEVTYELKKATVRYIGTNCNVWTVETAAGVNSYGNDDSKGQVSGTTCDEIGQFFDEAYTLVRNVFGNESDEMITENTQTASDLKNMTDYSDTGTKVNIVLYDLGPLDSKTVQEYVKQGISEVEARANGVQGYFSGKDYYTFQTATIGRESLTTYSNMGKYFYVDSYAINLYKEESYSTLVHEFQHMIHLNQKTFNDKINAASETWFNEMLSLLCEDVLKEKTNPGDTKGNGLVGRLQNFNQYYWLSGVEYNTDDASGASISYATLYTFGAYLLRTYGGVELLKKMSTNNYVNESAIIQAIQALGKNKTVGGADLSMANLIAEFCDDVLIGKDNEGLRKPEITYSSSGISYQYPLKPLNVKAEDYAWISETRQNGQTVYWPGENSFYNQLVGKPVDGGGQVKHAVGPLLFKPGVFFQGATLRPYGFIFYYLGTTSGKDSISLNVSAGSANQQLILVYEE